MTGSDSSAFLDFNDVTNKGECCHISGGCCRQYEFVGDPELGKWGDLVGNFRRGAPLSMLAGRRAGDMASVLEQGIQPIRYKAGEEGGNRLTSGFEGEKKECKFDLVDKKWDKAARQRLVFVRGVCKSRMKRPCHEPGNEAHQAKNRQN